MLQINTFCNLSKMKIFKSYEQILTKTFYFASPIFVEALDAKWSPPEFLQNFRKWFKASIKFTKLLLDPFANKEENMRGGGSENRHGIFSLSLQGIHWRHDAVAAVPHAALLSPGPPSLVDKEGTARALPLSPCSLFLSPHETLAAHLPPPPCRAPCRRLRSPQS